MTEIELKNFIYEKCFILQKHLTYDKYINNNSSLKEETENILKICGMTRPIHPNSYVVKNHSTILIFQPFDYKQHIYAVSAIYTDEKNRNQGSAKKLLASLDFFGSLYFDTYTPELISLLKSMGAYEENVINNHPSTQLILDINKTPSPELVHQVIRKIYEEENFDR